MRYVNIFIVFISLLFCPSISSEEKNIREDLVVINVEVPVRVMFKGEPVDDLKKSDFKLFENGKQIPINGFNIIRKRISGQKIEFDSEREQYYEPRLFALVFSLVQYNKDLEEGLNHVFEKVLKDSDKLLVLINNKLLIYNNLQKKKEIFRKVKKILRNEGNIARARLERTLMKVERNLRLALSGRRPDKKRTIYNFLEHYLRMFQDYKIEFLTADINKYYNFSKYLEKIKIKKWVISFYQVELFPKLSGKMDSILEGIRGYIEQWRTSTDAEVLYYVRQIEKLIARIFREQSADISFDTDEISKLFYKVNTTFHSVLIPSRVQLVSQDFEYKRISTSLENNLREITDKTGGKLLTSTDLGSAVDTIRESQDIVYMITYAPETESRRGQLKISLNNKDYKIVYDDNVRANYLKKYLSKKSKKKKIVEIDKISFEKKRLTLNLKNYKRDKGDGKISKCKVGIRIEVKKGDNSIFNEGKVLQSHNKDMEISINMNWLDTGKYDLLIDIKDQLTERSAFEYLKIDVK